MARALSSLQRTLVGLELFVLVGALVGGIGLLVAPDGSALGMSPQLLSGTPFTDYRVPGLVLLVANAALPAAVVVGTLRHRPWARRGHVVCGLVLLGWIVVQVALIGWVAALQPLLGGIGVAIALLGVRAR